MVLPTNAKNIIDGAFEQRGSFFKKEEPTREITFTMRKKHLAFLELLMRKENPENLIITGNTVSTDGYS